MNTPLRMGLVGTGYWADVTHASGCDAAPSWKLSSVWGRDAERAEDLARKHGVTHSGTDFDAFLDQVDAVTFAVPPNVQSTLALRAMAAGKHVVLEKPIALDVDSAERLVAAAAEHDVATVVTFTMLFDPRVRAIVADVEAGRRRWSGAAGLWLGSALNDDNPFNTPWRREKGALWDLAPHAFAIMWRTIGPIRDVVSVVREGGLTHLVFLHEDGRTSTVTVTVSAPDAADGFSTHLWGEHGRLEVPVDDVDPVMAFATAYEELAALIRSGSRSHDCDVRFGADIVRMIARAEECGSDGLEAT